MSLPHQLPSWICLWYHPELRVRSKTYRPGLYYRYFNYSNGLLSKEIGHHCCGLFQYSGATCLKFVRHFRSSRSRRCIGLWSKLCYAPHVAPHTSCNTSFGNYSKQRLSLDPGGSGSMISDPRASVSTAATICSLRESKSALRRPCSSSRLPR